MLRAVQQSKVEYLVLAFIILTISYLVRALRWRVLLSAEKDTHPITVFWGINVGYLGNSFLPARAGELIRAVLIGRHEGISKSFVLATALAERIIDAVFLVLFALAALATFDTIPEWLQTAVRIMGIVGGGGLLALLIAPHFEAVIIKLLYRLPQQLHHRLIAFAQEFLAGMRALQNGRRAITYAICTLVLWALDVLVSLQVAASFNLALTFPQALLLLAALGLASAAPSTPGYIGIYQFVAVTVLTPFGYAQPDVLVFIFAFQLVLYATVVIWGLIGLWRLRSTKTPVADTA